MKDQYKSSMTGTTRGFYVEARHNPIVPGPSIRPPPKVGDIYLSKDWARIRFAEAPKDLGIPNTISIPGMRETEILGYATAKGLMAWAATHHMYSDGIEFRLVKVEVTYTAETKTLQYGDIECFDWMAQLDLNWTPFVEESDADV